MGLIAGNWKMNKTFQEVKSYLDDFKLYVKSAKSEIVLCAPYPYLQYMATELKGSKIQVGAQDIYHEEQGAFTGEVSVLMVKDFAKYVIIGHSERRSAGETNQQINKKILLALKHKLQIIFCAGETAEQRKNGQTNPVLEVQLREALTQVTIEQITRIAIAYEPVWAIGTGVNAEPKQIADAYIFMRQLLSTIYNNTTAKNIKLIYGGSVTKDNVNDILALKDNSGCLVGGASLDPSVFAHIAKAQ